MSASDRIMPSVHSRGTGGPRRCMHFHQPRRHSHPNPILVSVAAGVGRVPVGPCFAPPGPTPVGPVDCADTAMGIVSSEHDGGGGGGGDVNAEIHLQRNRNRCPNRCSRRSPFRWDQRRCRCHRVFLHCCVDDKNHWNPPPFLGGAPRGSQDSRAIRRGGRGGHYRRARTHSA